MTYQPYYTYKDSAQGWLGDIPEHWEILKIGQCFQQRKEKVSDKDFEPLSVTMQGIVPQLETAAKSDSGDDRKKVCVGDFVINSRSDRKGSSGVSQLDGSVSLISIVLEPLVHEREYIHYLLRAINFQEEFYRNGKGIVDDLWSTKYSEMKKIKVPVPPPKEQKAIAEFIDRKTTQIDAHIAKQEKLIELLKERRTATINKAVTRGLDESVTCKDSGIEWLGEIPEHWGVLKLKFILKERNIRSKTGDELLLSLSKYQGVIPKANLEERVGQAENLIGYKKVEYNDLVINKMQAVNGLIGVSKLTGITSPDYSIYFLAHEKMSIDFIGYLLTHPIYLAEYKKVVTGVMDGFIRLYTDDLFDIKISFPSLEEQKRIVKYIESESQKINKTIITIEKEIVALKEYRQSLISNAVTGKIKVVENI